METCHYKAVVLLNLIFTEPCEWNAILLAECNARDTDHSHK